MNISVYIYNIYIYSFIYLYTCSFVHLSICMMCEIIEWMTLNKLHIYMQSIVIEKVRINFQISISLIHELSAVLG